MCQNIHAGISTNVQCLFDEQININVDFCACVFGKTKVVHNKKVDHIDKPPLTFDNNSGIIKLPLCLMDLLGSSGVAQSQR